MESLHIGRDSTPLVSRSSIAYQDNTSIAAAEGLIEAFVGFRLSGIWQD